MEEWKEYKLGEITVMKNGKKRPHKEGCYPVYGGNGIMDYSSDFNSEKVVIVGRVGAYCGCVYKCDEKCWVSDNAIAVFPKESVDFHFLYYLMSILDFHHHHIGGAQPLMTQDIIGDFNIKLPSLNVQHQIASILKSLDDKIEVNRRINDNLEQQAQALFKSWFVDFEPFKDGEFVESELGMIPKGWRVEKLEIISNIKYGKGISKNDLCKNGFPVFGGNGIIGFYDKYLYELPQILISCRGAASGKIIESYPKSFVTSNSLVLELNNRCYYNYLKCFLMENPLYDYATGSAQPQITIDNIKNVPILIPKLEDLQKLNSFLEGIYNFQWKITCENNSLTSLRDTLLPRLMSGELKINDVSV